MWTVTELVLKYLFLLLSPKQERERRKRKRKEEREKKLMTRTGSEIRRKLRKQRHQQGFRPGLRNEIWWRDTTRLSLPFFSLSLTLSPLFLSFLPTQQVTFYVLSEVNIITPLIAILIGVIGSLVFSAIAVIIAVTIKSCRSRNQYKGDNFFRDLFSFIFFCLHFFCSYFSIQFFPLKFFF